jgi:hypothetical protein
MLDCIINGENVGGESGFLREEFIRMNRIGWMADTGVWTTKIAQGRERREKRAVTFREAGRKARMKTEFRLYPSFPADLTQAKQLNNPGRIPGFTGDHSPDYQCVGEDTCCYTMTVFSGEMYAL